MAPAFGLLLQQATDDRLRRFCDYVESQWLDSTIWPPHCLSVFQQVHRTNNECEGWHRRLNSRASRSKLPLYLLLKLLHHEAAVASLQAELVLQGQSDRDSRPEVQRRQRQLVGLWQQYEAGLLSMPEFLRSAALQTPNEF
jgi:hypothetical protein